MRDGVLLIMFAVAVLCAGDGRAQSPAVIFTPDSDTNRALAGRDLRDIPVIRYEVIDGKLVLDPRLPPAWTWIAGRGIGGSAGPIEFFFHNGILFTNSSEPEFVSFRTRRYPDVFTDRIRANVFVIGMQKEDEGVIFAATEEAADVALDVEPGVFRRPVSLRFRLEANEGRLIRLLRRYPPYLP